MTKTMTDWRLSETGRHGKLKVRQHVWVYVWLCACVCLGVSRWCDFIEICEVSMIG